MPPHIPPPRPRTAEELAGLPPRTLVNPGTNDPPEFSEPRAANAPPEGTPMPDASHDVFDPDAVSVPGRSKTSEIDEVVDGLPANLGASLDEAVKRGPGFPVADYATALRMLRDDLQKEVDLYKAGLIDPATVLPGED